ncbi:protein-disulfide reductase DsbD [Methylobacter sp. S3L5C]|uniref:protein-disulfide reductase DsbD n=1 Tax=Methylobacter sp. S3L5C TaxID=2839024 RepID=UPI001FACDC97|nr:protein-disulfide reductase DsbD [Methylobacter sp. S3L5C]UOA08820.1 protein-disulfide reductase DsbD [Methylobacter sp. S3L5C]
MPFLKLIFFCFILLLTHSAVVVAEQELLPPDQAFKISVKAITTDQLEISWDIAEGYYLYRDKIQFTSKTEQIRIVPPIFPAGKTKHDENFGDVVIYRNHLQIPVSLVVANQTPSIKLLVQYQGCADRGICYPPQKKIIDIILPVATPVTNDNPLERLLKKLPGLKLDPTQDELLPAEQAFQFFATIKDANTIHVNWEIAKGYYLYREKIQLELTNETGNQLGPYVIPQGIPKHDEAFGQVETFYNELGFDLPIIRTNSSTNSITLQAGFQGCADRGVCYPPMTKKIDLELPAVQNIMSVAVTQAPPAISEQDQIVQSLKNDSLAMTLLSFFGFGLLLSMTPCIFPMIPILSGIIVGHGNRITTARAFLLSLSYVVASAFTYTVFGILAALFGSNLQTTFQQPWIVVLFSAIFVLLSLSMFGFYELELPNSLKTKLHNSSERHRDGSLWGAAIMGALSSLIVGPCVAAPLAGALIFIGQSGSALLGGSALFAMGLGMGVPLLLLGASAGKLLPKAGTWLYSTKAVFGVIMLAVAVWMLSRILPPSITILLWAMLLILPAIYLSAIDSLPENSSGWRKLWKGVGLIMLAYGLLLLIGFSMGNSNPLKPLQGFGINNAQATEQGLVFEKVASLSALESRIQQASANHQPVMLDFYADWCISCKEMEAYTFADPKVKQALNGFVLLQADVTKNSDDDKALLAKFNLIGPPAILFFSTNNQEKAAHRVIGYQDAETFINTLQRVKL